ncbi:MULTISPECIES: hypothetical protein [unclassified Corynebacterium]|uniref:hypothetical protein n=1 Tax=unclassified Corynebacterium TaxID=2624378 RepID=UPI0029CA115C|nr:MULTISPECIES: hypothetical protein [unclassified Corynebacterium]WPF66116.1 hypothetical protein OLX12_11310 [Corynebacterium sp. 22KM0430]WPF68608.1 hypothetical protein OLW90_11305 [Corynebacterium sp. 21KM1197]
MLNPRNFRYADALGAGALTYASVMIQSDGWRDFLHDPLYPIMYGAWFLIALFFSLRRGFREKSLSRVLIFYAVTLLIFFTLLNGVGRILITAISLVNLLNLAFPRRTP